MLILLLACATPAPESSPEAPVPDGTQAWGAVDGGYRFERRD